MYKCCFLACFCASQRVQRLRAELTFNNDLRTPKKITRSDVPDGPKVAPAVYSSKCQNWRLKRKSVKGEWPGTRRTVSHVDDDSEVDNHSEGDAAARSSKTPTEKETKCQPERRTAGRVRTGVWWGGGVISKLSELFAAININWHFILINAFIQSFTHSTCKTYA